jgi:DNA-directed RNA polymerase specialized sigma24 family protein
VRPRIFDNRLVTGLMKDYASSKRKKVKLRDQIMELAQPLIKAAIAKKRLYRYRDDLMQECAIRVLQALPKFKPSRGDAFGFLWATICNTCITQNQKLMAQPGDSLSDEKTLKKAENSTDLKDDPARLHVLKKLAGKIESAIAVEGFGSILHRQRKRVFRYIRKSILNEDLFYNRNKVLGRLRRMGLTRKEAILCIDHVLVSVRNTLYSQVEEAHAAQTKYARKVGSHISEESHE